MYSSQMYIFVGMWRIYLHMQFSCTIMMKHIIHFKRLTYYISLFFGGFIMLLCLMVNGSTELVEAKKFVIFWTWKSIEEYTNRLIDNIPETLSAIRFGVDIRKLHVWSCVHHIKYLAEMKLTENGTHYIKWTWLGIDPVWKYYFYCWLIVLI